MHACMQGVGVTVKSAGVVTVAAVKVVVVVVVFI